jgi:hypothetical protein
MVVQSLSQLDVMNRLLNVFYLTFCSIFSSIRDTAGHMRALLRVKELISFIFLRFVCGYSPQAFGFME